LRIATLESARDPVRVKADGCEQPPRRSEQEGRPRKVDVPRNERPGANHDGQRHWEAKDSEVASRLEPATELSGCKTKDSDSRKRSGSREGECDDCEQSPHQDEQEGHRRKGDVPRNERPGGNHHGQRLWEAIDSEVASRL